LANARTPETVSPQPAPTASPAVQPVSASPPASLPPAPAAAAHADGASAEDARTDTEFAAKIIEKASRRLQIEDNEDALAAAIVRGLEQMKQEKEIVAADIATDVADDIDGCDIADDSLDGDAANAAELNALMAAQLRGEEGCAE
jgi:hypothetical protein